MANSFEKRRYGWTPTTVDGVTREKEKRERDSNEITPARELGDSSIPCSFCVDLNSPKAAIDRVTDPCDTEHIPL